MRTGLVWLRIGTGEFGIEPLCSIKCWETIECPTTRDLLSSSQFHGVSIVYNINYNKFLLIPLHF
jgi:hypothetical protein